MSLITCRAWKCDVCGWTWIYVEGKMPVQCPAKDCRTRKWNSKAVEIPIQPILEPARIVRPDPSHGFASVDAFLQGLGKREPESESRPLCTYKEYDTESGEWYGCRLLAHGPKVKHQRGSAL